MEIRRSLTILLICSTLAYTKGNTFNVRYNGGSVPSKVQPFDWGNKLTITSDNITLIFQDRLPKSKEHVSLVIPSKNATGLSYGQEAHRRVGTMVALAVLLTPLALFGLFHQTRLHFIGIQYKTPEGTGGGILLQGDKNDYRSLLVALQGVTGLPVSVSGKEREFVPVGLTLSVTAESTNADPAKADMVKGDSPLAVPPTKASATQPDPSALDSSKQAQTEARPQPLMRAIPTTEQASPRAMTNQDVIELKAAGLSDEFVIAKIQRSPAGYQLDTSDIVALKRSNISEPVIQAMMAAAAPTPQQPSVPPTAANAPTQSQPPPQPPSPATAPTASAGSAQQTNQNTAATEPPKDGLLTRLKRVFSDDGETRKPSTPQTLPAEQQAPPQISLVPITVISKPAGARISVDGYPAGFTPSIVKLMPGTYKLTLQADGLPAYTQQITVEPGQVRSFGVVLDTPK